MSTSNSLMLPEHAEQMLADAFGSTRERIAELLGKCTVDALPLDLALEETGLHLSPEALSALAQVLGIPTMTGDDFPTSLVRFDGVSPAFLRRNGLLPLLDGDTLLLVASDPFNWPAIASVETRHGEAASLHLGDRTEVLTYLDRLFNEGKKSSGDGTDSETTATDLDALLSKAKQTPVVRRVEYLVNRALDLKASDIHFEPLENDLQVRIRVDGILHRLDTIPKDMQAAVISRLKLLGGMDIAERRLPQDGSSSWRYDKGQVDIRISSTPTLHGESVVLRLLAKNEAMYDLEGLGMAAGVLEAVDKLITRPHGMILVTGPTGSGKTTTLYSVLRKLKSRTQKIITVEDPVEYKMDGINQMQVKPGIGLGFAQALRSIVRQDPDVLLVGEIRDGETASIAIESALTGHLVFSTLHTKDAPGAITRLRDLGIEPFLIADSVLAVLAQRLVRKLCPHCKTSYQPEDSELALFRDAGLRIQAPQLLHKAAPQGCERCGNTGYRGRIGIYELLLVDDAVRSDIVGGKDAGNIAGTARRTGYAPMLRDGAQKIAEGLTSIAEVLRVTSFT